MGSDRLTKAPLFRCGARNVNLRASCGRDTENAGSLSIQTNPVIGRVGGALSGQACEATTLTVGANPAASIVPVTIALAVESTEQVRPISRGGVCLGMTLGNSVLKWI
jgi:hypothetical protein